VLQELLSPTELTEADANPAHRWAVRLTRVLHDIDPSGGLFEPGGLDVPLDITRIEWEAADALPFALCLGVAEAPERSISVALGNIVLADHGRSLPPEALAAVSHELRRYAPPPRRAERCEPPEQPRVPVRYRPALAAAPLTWGFDVAALLQALPSANADDPPMWPASLLLALPPRAATPQARLHSVFGLLSSTWLPQSDLLNSSASDLHFVVETEHERSSTLRFGDDRNGQRPNPGTLFSAHYRVGSGSAGNVGAGSLAHLVLDAALYADAPATLPDAASFVAVSNPLPAAGGSEPEDVQAARRDAPEAFRTQERAVTPADYAAAAERSGEVQRAAATFRWTGSWHTVFVSADRPGNAEVDAGFERRLRRHLERFRMAGYDLEVDGPRYVALDLALHLCVAEGHFRADVLQAVKQVLGAQRQADGTLALFHPDNFSFGDPVYLSRVVAAAQAVPGVASVRVDKFDRMVGGSPTALADGLVRTGRLEIAQLANNPNFRERGRLALTAGGGL
jgi:Baseplate J-like protein